ncbi:MAG: energy transducer TonB, partial [Verrucomicrobiota bacterium]|nr:energy transducer TonB [Verrucomicrobiota bacterium]
PAPTGPVSFISAKANLTSAPRPSYPYEARRARQTGSGKFLLIFNSSGSVTDVQVTQSTGSAILDQTSMQTFRRWRCRPGAYSKVYVPITYTMEGAQL